MSRNSGKNARKGINSEFSFKTIHPLNAKQQDYLTAIRNNSIIFGIGSAGTGKTFIATNYAASELYYRNINKIILTRPNIEVGKGLGFIPGTIEEKYRPYLEPFENILMYSLGQGLFKYSLDKGEIQPKPLGFLRGATFERCVVLADEMQNASISEMKMLLSRIGNDCKMIISGDPEQSDIPNSGLMDAVNRLQYVEDVVAVRFSENDIVRSPLCKKIILAYNK